MCSDLVFDCWARKVPTLGKVFWWELSGGWLGVSLFNGEKWCGNFKSSNKVRRKNKVFLKINASLAYSWWDGNQNATFHLIWWSDFTTFPGQTRLSQNLLSRWYFRKEKYFHIRLRLSPNSISSSQWGKVSINSLQQKYGMLIEGERVVVLVFVIKTL